MSFSDKIFGKSRNSKSKKSSAPKKRLLRIESLESREMLSANTFDAVDFMDADTAITNAAVRTDLPVGSELILYINSGSCFELEILENRRVKLNVISTGTRYAIIAANSTNNNYTYSVSGNVGTLICPYKTATRKGTFNFVLTFTSNSGGTFKQTYTREAGLSLDGMMAPNASSGSFKIERPTTPGVQAPPRPASASVTLDLLGATLSWSRVSTATSYTVSSYNKNTDKWTTYKTGLTGTSLKISSIPSGVTAFAVHAVNSGGSSNGTIANVPVVKAPSAPYSASITVATNGSATLSWSSVSAATSYTVASYNKNTGKWTNYRSGLTGTSLAFSSIPSGVTAFAVHAVNSGGSSKGTVANVPVVKAPSQPYSASVSVGSGGTATISWSSVSTATSYRIVTYNKSTGQWTNYRSGLTGTSLFLSSIPSGVTAFAVHAVNSGGSSKGTVANVPAPGKPIGVSATGTSSTSAKISWNAVAGAKKYDLMIYNSNTKKWTKLTTVTGTSHTATNLSTAVTEIAVHAVNDAGRSQGAVAKIKKAPSNVTAVATATNSAKITWNGGGAIYEVSVYNSSTGQWNVRGVVSVTSFTLSNLTSSMTQVAVSVVNGSERTGRTTASILRAPAAVSAVATSATAAKFTWNAASGATKYDVMAYNQNTKNWVKLGTVTGTSYSTSYLSSAYTQISIHALNAAGRTNGTVASIVRAPSNVAARSLSSTSVAFSWNRVTGATSYELVVYNSVTKKWSTLTRVPGNSHTASNLPIGVTQVSVHAVNAAGRSAGATATIR